MFEPPVDALGGRGALFDPVGGMQNHTATLTRALDRRGVHQVVLTTRPPGAPRHERLGERAEVVRVGLPIRRFRQLWAWPAATLVRGLAHGANLVHAHLGEDFAVVPLALAASRTARCPLVLTLHCSLPHTHTPETTF